MKVAFTGKGGSGKTTISSLFSLYMAQCGRRTLLLDADINQHATAAIGAPAYPRSMGADMADIKSYLAGSNPLLSGGRAMLKTTPPGTGSKLVSLDGDDWFINEFTSESYGVRVAGAGYIPDSNIGVRCYHGLNGAVELVLSHMIDAPDDAVIVDMTAGADAFSSGLFTKPDALVVVVEPTRKSLDVYHQFTSRCKEYDIPLFVVANKVEDADDRAFIESEVLAVVAEIGLQSAIRKFEKGQTELRAALQIHEITAAFDALCDTLLAVNRDWNLVQQRAVAMHVKACNTWAGSEALRQVDKSFSLKAAAQKILLA
ncbi:ATP-binding protein [Candidatus Saccharibacteria bacterium]|nr:ATP-binding protein [Candidatus Saccharibacteria bacterium]